jgi:Flp pilus assembly protein TadD
MLKRAPTDAEARFQLALLHLKLRKFREARDGLLEFASLRPADPRPHFYLAIVYGDKLGKAEEAQAELEEYERLGGTEPTALTWLSELRAALGGSGSR